MSYRSESVRAVMSAISLALKHRGDSSSMTRAEHYEHALLIQAEKEMAESLDDLRANEDADTEFPKILVGPQGKSILVEDEAGETAARGEGFDYPIAAEPEYEEVEGDEEVEVDTDDAGDSDGDDQGDPADYPRKMTNAETGETRDATSGAEVEAFKKEGFALSQSPNSTKPKSVKKTVKVKRKVAKKSR